MLKCQLLMFPLGWGSGFVPAEFMIYVFFLVLIIDIFLSRFVRSRLYWVLHSLGLTVISTLMLLYLIIYFEGARSQVHRFNDLILIAHKRDEIGLELRYPDFPSSLNKAKGFSISRCNQFIFVFLLLKEQTKSLLLFLNVFNCCTDIFNTFFFNLDNLLRPFLFCYHFQAQACVIVWLSDWVWLSEDLMRMVVTALPCQCVEMRPESCCQM